MLGGQGSDEARIRWISGAGLVVFLLIDVFAIMTAGETLFSDFSWFILGFLTASFVAAAALTLPRRHTRPPKAR